MRLLDGGKPGKVPKESTNAYEVKPELVAKVPKVEGEGQAPRAYQFR